MARPFAAMALALVVSTAGCINLGTNAADYKGFSPDNAPHAGLNLTKPTRPAPSNPTPPPPPTKPTAPSQPDPGVVVKASWRVGDSWTYRASSGPLIGSETTISIVGFEKRANGGAFIQKTELRLRHQPTPHVTYAYVDSSSYGVLNISGDQVRFNHDPADLGPRFLRNGTYNFSVTRVQEPQNSYDQARTTHYVKNVTVKLVGPIKLKTEVGEFDTVQFRIRSAVEGSRAEPAISHRWYSTKVLNDVFLQSSNGEKLELVSYHLARR